MVSALAFGQESAGSLMQGAQQMTGQLTGAQQSAANKAICSAIAGNYKDAASASATALTDPKVLTTAASTFASSMNLSIGSATGMLKSYMSQNGTSILTSCAASGTVGGLTPHLPSVGGLPEAPKLPGN
jgi:hypothetical protein